MDKKSILLWALGLAVSAGLGYMGGRSPDARGDHTSFQDKESVSTRIPRFGDSNPSEKLNDKGTASALRKEGLDSLLRQYSRPTPQLLESELGRLSNTTFATGVDNDKFFKLFYLSYKWGQQAPRQALAFMDSLRDKPMGEFMRTMVLQGWVESNPEAVTAYINESKTGLERNPDILSMIAAEYGKASPADAFQWFSTLNDAQRKSVLPSLLSSIAETHPDRIKSFLHMIPTDELRNYDLYPQIAEKWAPADWNAAREWISQLPKNSKTTAMRSALGAIARIDPEKATDEYKKLDDSVKSLAADTILSGIANQSPLKALDWLFQNVPENERSWLAQRALGHGPLTPSDELTTRITSLPNGEIKDALLVQLLQKTSHLAKNDPADFPKNLDLAARIGDEEKRSNSINTIINYWTYSDPGATRQWVENSSLPPDQKKKYTNLCDKKMEQDAALKKLRGE